MCILLQLVFVRSKPFPLSFCLKTSIIFLINGSPRLPAPTRTQHARLRQSKLLQSINYALLGESNSHPDEEEGEYAWCCRCVRHLELDTKHVCEAPKKKKQLKCRTCSPFKHTCVGLHRTELALQPPLAWTSPFPRCRGASQSKCCSTGAVVKAFFNCSKALRASSVIANWGLGSPFFAPLVKSVKGATIMENMAMNRR